MASPEKAKMDPPAEQSESSTQADSDKTRPQKRVFVPNYEPIQTRKRAKAVPTTNVSPSPCPPSQAGPATVCRSAKKEVAAAAAAARKLNRSRLTRVEVNTPDVGPRPRAVPKSMLILEPEFLPRHLKKKTLRTQAQPQPHTSAASVQIHTSAMLGKSAGDVSWASSPSPGHLVVRATSEDSQVQPMQTVVVVSSADQLVDQQHAVVVDSAAGGLHSQSHSPADQPQVIIIGPGGEQVQRLTDQTVFSAAETQAHQPNVVSVYSTSAAQPFPESSVTSVTSAQMEAVVRAAEGEEVVQRSADGHTTSYILTTAEGTEDYITVTDGHIATHTEDGQSVTYTVISEAVGGVGSGCGGGEEVVVEGDGGGVGGVERSDTPTSLLLLAEAAYPSTSTSTLSSSSSTTTAAAQTMMVTSQTQAPPLSHNKSTLSPVVVQSPVKTITTISGTGQLLGSAEVADPPQTFMTVSCQGGKSTILASPTASIQDQTTFVEGQTISVESQTISAEGPTTATKRQPSTNSQTLFLRSQDPPKTLDTKVQTLGLRGQTSHEKDQAVCGEGESSASLPVVRTVSITTTTADSSLDSNPGPPQWTCMVCGEVMEARDREAHLTQHLDTAEEEDEDEEGEECVCEACGEQLRDAEDLELHMAVEHDEEEEEGGAEDEEQLEEGEDHASETATTATTTTSTTTNRTPSSTTTTTAINSNATSNTAVTSNMFGSPVYSCEQCGETFQYAAYLRRHLKVDHADSSTIHTCSLCPRSFTSLSALEVHHSCLHQRSGISFKCIRCSQSFSSASLLSNHARSCLRVAIPSGGSGSAGSQRGSQQGGRGVGRRGRGPSHGRGGNHACPVCDKAFSSEVYLKAHQLSHQNSARSQAGGPSLHKKQALQCLYCEDSFHHLGPLKEHMLGTHPTAFPFRCTICQRGFARDTSRQAHEQTHQTTKLHFCGECGEGFTLQTYLNRHHKYRHIKPVKFPCTMCPKEFVRQADRIKHMRVHTGEKPYVCEQCGHGFNQQSNYRYHMMRHRGEKPHVCPMCSKGFRVPSHLKMHMQQHLNERFTCPTCRKVFSQARYLQRHLRTHTKAKAVRGTEQVIVTPAPATARADPPGTLVVYENLPPTAQPLRTEQQVIVDSVSDLSEHVVVTETSAGGGVGEGGGEPIIQYIMQGGKEEGREVTVVDEEGNAVISTTTTTTTTLGVSPDTQTATQVSTTTTSAVGDEDEGGVGSSSNAVAEEQAYVNTDEGTRVVMGAFLEGEGGSVEDGSVTLPFRELTQLLGGKQYRCDVCSRGFAVRPDSMYNMIHTGQSHILVINLNDHLSASPHTHPHTES